MMRKAVLGVVAIQLALVSLAYAVADVSTVTKYAAACGSELGFTATSVPSLNSNDGQVFWSMCDVDRPALVN